ncbi:hypothetical protein [Sphingobium sp.]|uniref:hypothetical protein n=1 Tax=Sphingobium sp. TaxID=1912891 RepID=UPI0035C6DD0C
MTDAVDFLLHAPPSITVRTIAGFVETLRRACAEHPALTLDIGMVTDADLSFIQAVQAARAYLPGGVKLACPAGGAIAALLIRAGFAHDPADLDFWFHGELPQ